MFNQVSLMGKVKEIYEDCFEIQVNLSDYPIVVMLDEQKISQLLLNNLVGVKGHIEIDSESSSPNIICDELTILDGRGRKK